jgi:hypothetical protein
MPTVATHREPSPRPTLPSEPNISTGMVSAMLFVAGSILVIVSVPMSGIHAPPFAHGHAAIRPLRSRNLDVDDAIASGINAHEYAFLHHPNRLEAKSDEVAPAINVKRTEDLTRIASSKTLPIVLMLPMGWSWFAVPARGMDGTADQHGDTDGTG